MKIIGMVPARMESTRFFGKPLARICGMTMIQHVYERCCLSKTLDEVYVATCNEEIMEEVVSFGGKAIMTSNEHRNCIDRVAEACNNINTDADIVVVIQGDEPLTYPEMIDQAVSPFKTDKDLVCSNLISAIDSEEDFNNPNVIKVTKDLQNYALYFSREAVPSAKKCKETFNKYRQVCILPFKKDFLMKYVQMAPTPLEMVESVDMLRIIENGYKIKLVETIYKTMGVDDENDRLRVEEIMKDDPLFQSHYSKGINYAN
ncbi:MAG: 3-deoxy-manno-octulosonate cytidylyltransferase [Candidatus Omnitrophica bacterium]|nr:3-deoxy-manno-octulosonate cytidylyltransferase [Candidatus Omnitrophota bacterium]MCA9405508.1 3-deoxy-manno-octulosonate cytidylyltransferase [Candidatus Omnitrophota bacterium]